MRRTRTPRENELHIIIDPYVVTPASCREFKEPYQLKDGAPQEVRDARLELLKIIEEQRKLAMLLEDAC